MFTPHSAYPPLFHLWGNKKCHHQLRLESPLIVALDCLRFVELIIARKCKMGKDNLRDRWCDIMRLSRKGDEYVEKIIIMVQTQEGMQ